METKEINRILELTERPAFCTENGIITAANRAALSRQVPLNQSVEPLLISGRDAYADLSGGSLYLGLVICNTRFGATVTKMDSWDLFVLDPEFSSSELRTLALAARELRGPLERILAVTDGLLPKLANDGAPEEMARLNRGLYQLQRLVGNMSDAGATAMPQMELQDVPAVAHELFDQARDLCAAVGIELEFTNLPISVCALIDRDRLERGIYNILSNSLKYAATGSSIRASLTLRGSTLCFTVCDSGPGMESGAYQDAFSRYLREPGVEDPRQGIGLGLTLVRTAAMVHGGTVLMSPGKNGGTQTILTIPIRQTNTVHSHPLRIDYTGERNHGLIELADSLPPELYTPGKI